MELVNVDFNWDGDNEYVFSMTGKEFHHVLTQEFASKVEKKEYSKIPYNTWRVLSKINYPTIYLDFMEISGYVYLLDSDHENISISFSISDGSFGSFLYANYLKKGMTQKMSSVYDSVAAVSNTAYADSNCAIDELVAKVSSCYADTVTTTYPNDYNTYATSICSFATESDISELRTKLDKIKNELKEVIRDNEVHSSRTAALETQGYEGRCQISELFDTKADKWDVDALFQEKANVADVSYLYDEINRLISKIDTKANRAEIDAALREIQERLGAIEECADDAISAAINEAYTYATEYADKAIQEYEDRNTIFKQGTFSNVYEKKNYKLNLNFKENEKMKNFVNFDFGPCTGDNVRMSMYGLAVKNVSGVWVSYDAANHAVMDVDVFNFDGAKFLYKMPVAIKDVKAGDVVIHARKPMFVTRVGETSLWAVDPVEGENKEIMLTKSPFGFNFVTKVVNFMSGMTGNEVSADCPFGNMWMLMMMDGGSDMSDMLLPMMMMNGGNMGNMNPMMMYMLMGDKGDVKDMLPWMFMMNSMGAAAGTTAQ